MENVLANYFHHLADRPHHPHFHAFPIPNDKITADDAHLFTKSVPLSGPSAVSWADALRSTAPLLRCDESWARFGGNYEHEGMSDIGPKLHACPASAASPRHPVLGPGFCGFPSLPAEIRHRIWCSLEQPSVAVVKAYAYSVGNGRPIKLIIWTPGTEKYMQDSGKSLYRDWAQWAAMRLHDVSLESQEAAAREFGRPSHDSLPFRSSVDELRIMVNGEAILHHNGWAVHCLQMCDCGRQKCRRCKNSKLINDPSIGVLLATTNPHLDEHNIPQLVVPSADFLNRIHRVTIDLVGDRDEGENGGFHMGQEDDLSPSRYQGLAAGLRRHLPSLSILTIFVAPMRCETAEEPNPHLTNESHDPATTDLYHVERISLVEDLTSLVEVRHADGCDGLLENCRCPMSPPFPKLKRLVVRVDTRLKLTHYRLPAGGRVQTPVLEARFETKPILARNLIKIKKGFLPLLSNTLDMGGVGA